MTHNSEDELLGYALEAIASDEERASIAAHLAVCSECRMRLKNLRKDIEIIGGVGPRQRVLRIPSPRPRALGIPGLRPHIRWTPTPRPREAVTHTILRTAALIVLGILVGFGASRGVHREPEFVSSAYVTLSPPTDSLTGYTVSDATDIPVHYYERLLEQRK
jgi:anti-sigma factor RsiW